MALIKDMAITLRRLDYSETSQVLVMLTRQHGQQRLIAKGIKRSTKTRVAVGIDLLELGRLVFSRRPGKEDNLATLTEWRQEDNFAHLRRDLARCYAAQYAAEVTSHLTEVHDPHPALFDGLHRLLLALEHEEVLAALVVYLWLMLAEIGLRPELSRCVECNRQTAGDALLYFSSRQGGAVCRDCEPALVEKRRMPPATARSLVMATPPDGDQALACFDLLDYHITEIMARPPRVSGLLRQAIKAPKC
ncbi:MAG: DNA repair protein RecO [Phycisphaerae bacterium]|nr:DNA repair protein RecO [Phycisphaerae bacterium]